MESDSPVKDVLYRELTKLTEKKIQSEISKKNSSKIINEIISNCYSKILQIPGEKDENFGILAESLMHYLLTISLIPSQRKISVNNLDLDIVIPNLILLKEKPEDSLIISFPKSGNIEKVNQRITEMKKITSLENIWLVLHTDLPVNEKKYLIGNDNDSFNNILEDITIFLSKRKQSKLKILKSWEIKCYLTKDLISISLETIYEILSIVKSCIYGIEPITGIPVNDSRSLLSSFIG